MESYDKLKKQYDAMKKRERERFCAASCSRITQRQLEDILTHEGIVQHDAVEDPEGYDHGATENAIAIVTQKINELLSENSSVHSSASRAESPADRLGGCAGTRDRSAMTKGQLEAQEIIEEFLGNEAEALPWDEIVTRVRASKARVKNWMTIRGVVQWFINEGLIERTKDVHKEEWIVIQPAAAKYLKALSVAGHGE